MKTLLRSAARGFLWGILAHYLFTLGISLILRLGYYAPCLVSMGERFGGKLNGALVECLCAAILGAGLAAEELRQKLQNDGVHYYHEAG